MSIIGEWWVSHWPTNTNLVQLKFRFKYTCIANIGALTRTMPI